MAGRALVETLLVGVVGLDRDLGQAVEDLLGREGTGWGLDDDASAALRLPAKDEVLAFATEAFDAAEDVFGQFRDDELLLPTGNLYGEEGLGDPRPLRLVHGARGAPPGDDRGAQGRPRDARNRHELGRG